MSAGLPLAEFTALLARQLAESATMADRRQRDEYVALAAEVDGTLESFVDRVIGCTEKERRATAARYITEVVLPFLPRSNGVPYAADETLIRFDKGGHDRLIEHFGEMIREVLEMGTSAGLWVMEREKLERSILDKLRRDAERRYSDVRALLRAGVPRTQIQGGRLSAKVLLEENGGGSVMVRLASMEAAKECGDVISTLMIDFTVGVFPAFE